MTLQELGTETMSQVLADSILLVKEVAECAFIVLRGAWNQERHFLYTIGAFSL